MEEFRVLPDWLGFLLAAAYPFIAIGAWLGAIAAAWRHRRDLMAVLIAIAMVASAATLITALQT